MLHVYWSLAVAIESVVLYYRPCVVNRLRHTRAAASPRSSDGEGLEFIP